MHCAKQSNQRWDWWKDLSVHATASIHIQILTCIWTHTGSNTMAWPLTSHILSSHLNICASAYLTWLNNDDGQCKTSCDRSWGSVNHILDLLCAQRGVSRDKVNPFWTSGWVFIAVVITPASTMSCGAQTPCVRERYVTLAFKPHACLHSPNPCRLSRFLYSSHNELYRV